MREMKDSGIEWIGEIPDDWRIIRNKNAFTCSKELVGEKSELTQLLSLTTRGIKKKDINNAEGKLPESFDTYQFVKENDLVMCLFDLDCSAVFSGISPYNGMISPAYRVLSCKKCMEPKYADYWFQYISDGRKFNHYAKNIRYTLSYEEFSALPLLLPERNEQRRIADYLDRKCGQIDATIARQQEVIEKLKAYKLSVITEAVTKGLNPDMPMKDSGVEWIGKIPEHWQVPKIKYLATIASGGTPDRSHPEYWNGSINWVKTGELQNSELYETEEKITELALENSSAKVFGVDNILVAMYGQGKTRGMTALLKVPSATNQACAGITVYSKDITVSYLWLFLMGAYDAIREKANGSGQPNLSGTLIADFNVTLPPIDEQMNICKTVAMRLPHIDSIIEQKETIVDKLTAYKKSLIYEVVTGKKEV